MVKKIKMASANYSPPSAQALGGAILDNNTVVHIQDHDSRIASASAGQYGTALVSDGATILRHSMLNLLLVCVVWSKALFIMCKDCSDHIAGGGSKDAKYMTGLIKTSMSECECAVIVDVVITDGASDMVSFRRLLQGQFYWMWPLWCMCHVCNNMMKAMANCDPSIEELIKRRS